MSATKHLILIGFMGVGKSTVGKRVAHELGLPFYDNDQWVVEQASGMSIPRIFAEEKEEGFRKREITALTTILGLEPGIASTGGGYVSTELGRKSLKDCGVPVVYLQLDFETAAERVEADNENVRPLFDNRENALGLFTMRQDWYLEVATAIVDASRPLDVVAQELAKQVI